ncbi:selenium binding protein [Pectobacterium punjabense]|uniref:selenium binding protein n=1 Tax=Pectobacterium punjabense TaxID=2108399 RepID=UPI0038189759
MYEDYSHQAVPSKKYRELVGTAIYVFNSNNDFLIENIIRNDEEGKYTWHLLIDKTSGQLAPMIKETITRSSDSTVAELFEEIVNIRNRIIHSFAVTGPEGLTDDPDHQILATKHRNGAQEIITEEYLKNFIMKNDELSNKLHKFRGF